MELGSLQKAARKRPAPVLFELVLKEIAKALTKLTSCEQVVTEADRYAISYLQHNITRKRAPKAPDPRLKSAALEAFLEREKLNALINARHTFGYAAGSYCVDRRESKVLDLASKIISKMLGRAPSVEELIGDGEFGNGASATLCRSQAQREKKYLHGLSTTRKLLPFASIAVNGSPSWAAAIAPEVFAVTPDGVVSHSDLIFQIIQGSVFDTVPKDCVKDRVIMKEPTLNGYLQKALGKTLRRRLGNCSFNGRNISVDLNRSGAINSELAREGSISGICATIDAKSASDSLTICLYDRLFPAEWYDLFMLLRSPYVTIPGEEGDSLHRLEMMSGMGNGFTFEAESIIFYSIGLAATMLYSETPFGELLCSIHGDDLVVPSDVFDIVADTYFYIGVEVNREKSFFCGKFRESCGGHWYSGLSVKPFYVKNQRGDCRGDWFWLSNSLLLWMCDRSDRAVVEALRPLLLFCRFYAASGRPCEWRCSLDHGRRTGLYSTKPPKLQGAWYYTRAVLEKSTKTPLPEAGRYLAQLDNPKGSPSVLDLLQHRHNQVTDYALRETIEKDGRRRFSVFIPISQTSYSV